MSLEVAAIFLAIKQTEKLNRQGGCSSRALADVFAMYTCHFLFADSVLDYILNICTISLSVLKPNANIRSCYKARRRMYEPRYSSTWTHEHNKLKVQHLPGSHAGTSLHPKSLYGLVLKWPPSSGFQDDIRGPQVTSSFPFFCSFHVPLSLPLSNF